MEIARLSAYCTSRCTWSVSPLKSTRWASSGLSLVGLTVGSCRCVTGTASNRQRRSRTCWAGCWGVPGGVQRRAAYPRRGVSGRGETVRQRDSTPSHHRCKTTEARAWLCEVPSVALVQSVNDSRRAWRNFFDPIRVSVVVACWPPRFKSRKDHRQSFRLTRNGFSLKPTGRLFVAKVGEVTVRWSRELPSQPSSVTIIREPDGHYYASFVVDVVATPLPTVDREAGVDVGIARLATIATTDGQRVDVENPKHLGRKLRKLARLEREKSRRQKGSTTGTRRGAKSLSRTTRSRGLGGTITTSRLWRWCARTK